jgi:hypothetical protein
LLPSVSKKADFGKSDPQDSRDMSCGHEFTLGTHSKTGAFWSQLDRFKIAGAAKIATGSEKWR